ncbi:MAG TPA: GNAT family N-acetyltransferase [Acidimicrobiia bacterium]|jgi:GNAT superfamily N-acetyltransferase
MALEVVPATSDRWPDIIQLFEGHGPLGCWCQYWRRSSSDYRKGGPGSGEASLESEVEKGPPPGLIGYLDGEPAGWLGFWPRERLERLVRSRTIPKVDEVPVWSIVCFQIRVGFRRKGVAEGLLHGAVEHARSVGVPALEAYPIDPEGQRVDVAFGYVGFTSMFERAGFARVLETPARSAGRRRWLMRLQL